MLLALDVGKTNFSTGAFRGETLNGRWPLRTIHNVSDDLLLDNDYGRPHTILAGGIHPCS